MKRAIFTTLGLLLLFSCVDANKEARNRLETINEKGEKIRQKFIPDRRVGVFDVAYAVSGTEVKVIGKTTSSEVKQLLYEELTNAGYTVQDSMVLLPNAAALENKIYGVVNVSVCNMHRSDDFSSEMITQALLGMPVNVLERTAWYRVQTPDNYIAWVHRAAIVAMTKDEYNTWNSAEKIIVTSHYGFTYEKPDIHSQSVSDVVSGDRLKWEGTEGGFYRVSYPDGRRAYVSRTISQPEKAWRNELKQDAAEIVRTAKTLLGVPYLWAGTSAKGIDCSGYVRTVLFMHDIIMPRDASQQAYVGQHIDIASDFSNLQAGDLIFFGAKATAGRKERVVHVAISLGGTNFIHSQGDVRINSFDPEDARFDEYNLKRLLFATRVLNSIDTEGINTTTTNPYYLPR